MEMRGGSGCESVLQLLLKISEAFNKEEYKETVAGVKEVRSETSWNGAD